MSLSRKSKTSHLLQIKGVPGRINVKEVKFSLGSLNEGDSFIVDVGRKIYAWNGKEANSSERRAATTLGNEIVASRSFMRPKDFIWISSGIEEYEAEEQMLLELLPNKKKLMFGLMSKTIGIKSPEKGGKDEKQRRSSVKLYRVTLNPKQTQLRFRKCKQLRKPKNKMMATLSRNRNRKASADVSDAGQLSSDRSVLTSVASECFDDARTDETGSEPGVRSEGELSGLDKLMKAEREIFSDEWLYKRDCLVLDTGLVLYVWIGKKCKLRRISKSRKDLFDRNDKFEVEVMKEFNKRMKKPASLPWKVCKQDEETEDFLENFVDLPQL